MKEDKPESQVRRLLAEQTKQRKDEEKKKKSKKSVTHMEREMRRARQRHERRIRRMDAADRGESPDLADLSPLVKESSEGEDQEEGEEEEGNDVEGVAGRLERLVPCFACADKVLVQEDILEKLRDRSSRRASGHVQGSSSSRGARLPIVRRPGLHHRLLGRRGRRPRRTGPRVVALRRSGKALGVAREIWLAPGLDRVHPRVGLRGPPSVRGI